MTPTIRFRVTAVARRSSSEVNTVTYTYDAEGKVTPIRKRGAEWEEVEFGIDQEENPVIQVANVTGNAILAGNGNARLIINNPELFGTFKIDDIIDIMPTKPETVSSN